MRIEKQVQRLNALLRTELGEPVYAWKWSEDLIHVMRQVNDDGTPKYIYRCRCGEDVRVHAPDCSEVAVAVPAYTTRKMRPDLINRWTLCHLIPTQLTPAQWEEAFGGALPYAKSEWAPCDPVHLEPGEEPTEVITWEVIYAMRRERSKSIADLKSEFEAHDARKTKKKRSDILDSIKSEAPAFGGIPGRKEHVSFPSPQQQ